jgi:hypothetical protein
MQPADRADFTRVLNGIAAIKGKDLTPEAMSIWWSAMSGWSIDEFKSAASHLVCTCQFMPTPYDFTQLKLASEPTVGEAWLEVLGGCDLVPGSRIARAAAIVGGQYAIRHASIEKDLPFIQRRFEAAYSELTDVDASREALPQLGVLPGAANVLKRIA